MSLAVQAAGRPRSRFYEVAHRIARRFEPAVAAAFVAAIERLLERIDVNRLARAVRTDGADAEGATMALILSVIFDSDPALEVLLARTAGVSGRAAATVLSDVLSATVDFNARHPNVILYARRQSSELVVAVSEDVREAIRIVVALGASIGLTPVQQAIAIRQVVGLPPNWASAPLNLAQEIRDGLAAQATDRRLSAIDKAQIRSRIKRGTVTEEFVQQMQENYRKSLLNRRALNIARTESLRSANHGQREAWRQAVRDGHLPATARRVWIVTPDDRLRPTHAAVPGMNPDGVPLDGAFRTPLGPSEGPPLEPNCRCGEGLLFPGRGIL